MLIRVIWLSVQDGMALGVITRIRYAPNEFSVEFKVLWDLATASFCTL